MISRSIFNTYLDDIKKYIEKKKYDTCDVHRPIRFTKTEQFSIYIHNIILLRLLFRSKTDNIVVRRRWNFRKKKNRFFLFWKTHNSLGNDFQNTHVNSEANPK